MSVCLTVSFNHLAIILHRFPLPQVLVKVMGLREDPEEYVQDTSDDEEDELTGLLETVGEDPADPDAVAFLLPLRGRVGGLGIKLVGGGAWGDGAGRGRMCFLIALVWGFKLLALVVMCY